MRTSGLPFFRPAPFLLPLAMALGSVACSGAPGGDDTGSTTSDVTIQVLRGVDRAGAFSPGEARTLKSDFGIAWTGVYIGGPCDGGSGWDRSVVEAIHAATGWKFMPIYVGQNSRAVCGADNLTRSQGVADGNEAAARMAAFGWAGHQDIPVELDLEAETFDGGPALDYVRGWASAVHAKGYLAYVYSSPDAINSMAVNGVGIDGVTVASWLFNDGQGRFENVSPFDSAAGIGSHFNKHDRAWQYCGDIPTAVGGVDCNVSDLVLAPAPGQSNRAGGGGGGSTGGSGGGSPAPDACNKGDGFCTDTLQCDSGHWIVRHDDPAACTTVENVEEPCHEGGGYCTATLQCESGRWVPRVDDPAACTSGPGG
jgi:Rv2525c-like, glycoside hydrolase-like domain